LPNSDVARYRIGEQIRDRLATEAKVRQTAGLRQGKESRLPHVRQTEEPIHTDKEISKEVKLTGCPGSQTTQLLPNSDTTRRSGGEG
jgi:hypothetical protein